MRSKEGAPVTEEPTELGDDATSRCNRVGPMPRLHAGRWISKNANVTARTPLMPYSKMRSMTCRTGGSAVPTIDDPPSPLACETPTCSPCSIEPPTIACNLCISLQC